MDITQHHSTLSPYQAKIQECRKLKIALRESEERFRTLVENAPEAIVLLDGVTGKFVDVNRNAMKIFELERAELLKLGPGDISPEFQPGGRLSRDVAHEKITEAIEGGAPIFEWLHINSQGNALPCEIRLVRLVSNDRVLIRGSIVDISQRKIFDQRIQDHLNDLARSNAELEEFAYVASHDLQSPLKSIVNWIQMIEQRMPETEDVVLKCALKNVQENASKAITLIQDLMQLARINIKDQSVEKIDLNKTIESVCLELADELERIEGKIKYNTLPMIEGIPCHVEAIFKNLVKNAIQYRRKNLRLLIDIKCHNEESCFHFMVSDNGIGIASQNHRKIFDMFTRLSTQSSHLGSGIGLSFCKKAIELAKGKIWVESRPGAGSTFHITYPKVWRY